MAFNVLASYDTSSSPLDVALTRIDAGSQLDMVVANSGDNSISVRLGIVDGTFGPAQTSATGVNPHSLATGDFSSDGIADVVTANSSDVSLLVGNGNGSFQPPLSISLPELFPPGYSDPMPLAQSPRSVAVGDLNADGKLDLVVAGQTSFSVYKQYYSCGYYSCGYTGFWQTYDDGYVNVLIGDGSGGFATAETQHLGTFRSPNALAVADIDGDGKADVITSNNNDLSVLLGDGSGAVGSPINSGSGYPLNSISLGDVDGDGKVDTLLSTGYGGLSVQKGDGTGHFTALPSVSTGGPVNSAVMGDVNADGKLDLMAVGSLNEFHCTDYRYYGCYGGYATSTRQATVLLGNGLGNFALPLTSSLGSEADYSWLPHVALTDLTGDGKPELVTIDYYHNETIVATNDGDWNPPPAIVISDAATVVEGNSGTVYAVFTVTLVTLVGNHGNVSVNYATMNLGAIAGADYTSTSGTLTFTASDTSKTISVPILDDTLDEDDELFAVNLYGAVGGQITDSQGRATIQDDDAAPLVTINDVSKNEGSRGNTSFSFTVGLSAASGKWIYVYFATADGTATTAGGDYYANSGTVYLSPGQTTATLTVLVRGDKTKEANETFFVNLTGATNGTISDSQATGTIVNDDAGSAKGNPHGNSASLADTLLATDTSTTTRKRK